MRSHPPKVMLSGRVPQIEKIKLQKSGKSVAHAVHYFVEKVGDPVENIEIDIHFLKQEICDMKIDLIEKEQQLEELNAKLLEAKKSSRKHYPEIALKETADHFLHLFETNEYYEGVNIHDAINSVRKSLTDRVRGDGFSFEDIYDEILKEYSRRNTRTYYDSAENLKEV